MKRIVCFHLFNDYSGSPKVLEMVLDGLCKKDADVELVTSNSHGVLDNLNVHKNFKMRTYSYQFSEKPAVTMLRYTSVQILTFFMAFRYLFSKDTIFYINTLLPIGPALAGRLMGKHVVYHYHENADAKGAFYKILAKGMQILAHKIICVSKYQAQFLQRQDKIEVVTNALPKTLVNALHPDIENAFARNKVLMLGSLKAYKGTAEFIRLSEKLPQHQFTLVINDTQENIDNFIRENKLTVFDNLSLYPRQSDVAQFYNSSSLVLNLSNKDLFIETFGLTALEAMSAGLPIIVPSVGGIAEMVEDGVNGYKIDVKELDKIAAQTDKILNNKELYTTLATNALEVSKRYSADVMINEISNNLQI